MWTRLNKTPDRSSPNLFAPFKSVLKRLGDNTVGTTNEQCRHTWITETLKRIPNGSRLLDAGAGEGRYRGLCDHLKYVSQDFAQYDGKGDAKGLQTGAWDTSGIDIVCDITSIPEPDGSFDAVLCTEVFEHLPDPILALKEFSRLLRPGGVLILTAPFCSLTHFAPYHFYTGFNRYFYLKHCEDAGLDIVEMRENGNFFEFLAQELRRSPGIAATYGGQSIGFFGMAALWHLLRIFGKLSKRDRGSQELLSLGLHVRAVKK